MSKNQVYSDRLTLKPGAAKKRSPLHARIETRHALATIGGLAIDAHLPNSLRVGSGSHFVDFTVIGVDAAGRFTVLDVSVW